MSKCPKVVGLIDFMNIHEVKQTSVVNKPAITVAHRVRLFDDGDDAALGESEVQLLGRADILCDDIQLGLRVIRTHA